MIRRFNQHILRPIFRVQEGEGLRVALMLLYSIAVIGGVIITGQLASRALFLSSLPQSAVPYKFILPPVALMLVSALYTRLAGRIRSDRLILLTYSLILAGVVGFRLLMETEGRGSFAALSALFVYFDIIGSLVILQFWTFAGEIFNSREAKRLFGLISGGSAISNVLFGAFVTSIAGTVAPENLLFIVMGSLVVCLGCVWVLGRRYDGMLEEAEEEGRGGVEKRSASLWEDMREVFRAPLVRSMSGILILVALVSSIGDYQLDLGLQAWFGGDSQGMVRFLGQFRLWAGVGAVVLQFFIGGRLLERFGVVAVLLLLPSSILLGAGAILLTQGVLWAVAVPRACDVVFKYSVNDPAFNLLYLPVEAQLRAKARAILDGIAKPPMVSLLGLVFLWTGQRGSDTIVHWAYVALGLVVVWAALVRRAGGQYVAALSQSIRLRRLDPDQEKIDLSDEGSIRVIRETLQAENAPRVIHALTLLPRIPRVDWTPHVALLLEHPNREVRILALRFLGEREAAIYAEEVVARLRDPEEEVRAAAVETLCALGKLRAVPRVLPFLDDSSPRIRGAAVLGLIKHTGLDGFLHAAAHLKALLESPESEARLEGVRVLGVLQAPSFYHPLLPLLDDERIEVQVGAIRAAARIKAPELIPYLVPKLCHPLTRWYAVDALVQCIGQDLTRIEALLRDEGRNAEVRRHLIHVLRQQRSPEVVPLLSAQLECDDERVRAAVYEALLELRDRGLSVEPLRLEEALRGELRRAYEWHLVRGDLRQIHPLLEEALEYRIRQAEERLLALLDLLYAEISRTWLRQSLDERNSRLRATAVELLDNVVEREFDELLLPLFGGSDAEVLEVADRQLHMVSRPQREHLRQLACCADDWMRSCALHAIGEGRIEGLEEVVREAMDEAEPMVREAARVAYARLYGAADKGGRKELSELEVGLPEELPPREGRGEQRMALSTLEKVFFLKSVPLFEQIPGEDIVGMVPILREVNIEKGEMFIRNGEEGDCLYIVVGGEILVQSEERGEHIIHSREVIGERAVLTEQPRSADCTALTDVVALRIDKGDFWKLMEEQPKITIEVLKVLVDRYI